MIESRWGVVYTKPAMEQLAARAIVESGFRSYCPVQWCMARDARTHRLSPTERVARPLFARYVFAELEGGHFHGVLYSRGVVDLIRDSAGLPATLAAEIVEDLRERERNGEFDEARPGVSEFPSFAKGQSVRIIGGEWGGLVGTFAKMDSKTRATVLIEFLGRQNMPARVSRELLVAAEITS